jgi:hypothetical protein
MEKFFRINFIVVICCLLLKFLHVTGSTFFMFISVITLVLLGVITGIKNIKNNPQIALENLALSCWSIFMFFRFAFHPFLFRIMGISIIYWIPLIFSGASLAIFYERKIKLNPMGYVLIISVITNTVLLIIPTSSVYYMVHFREINNQILVEDQPAVLDSYSVILYNEDPKAKYEIAIEYNNKANQAVIRALKETKSEKLIQDSVLISNHKIQMENKVKSIKGD